MSLRVTIDHLYPHHIEQMRELLAASPRAPLSSLKETVVFESCNSTDLRIVYERKSKPSQPFYATLSNKRRKIK